MSLIGKLLGRREGDPYSEGLALYEAGHFAEAVVWLRTAERQQHRTAAGSLAAFFLRQALTQEGRRWLRAGRPDAALPFLEEAAATWSSFPDLHCLLGTAQALNGRWEDGLASAAAALRANADYVEARLLEVVCLTELDRRQEAAASLNKLVESGRRVDNVLVNELACPGGYTAATIPPGLAARLVLAAEGSNEEGEMAAAVALCRGGQWDDGVARLRTLCGRRPDYADYRLKLAAALYQTRRGDEALAEVDKALALNPHYRTAAHLKALILADGQRLSEARAVLEAHPALAGPNQGHPHEELFTAYLSSVLNLMTGRCHEALARLGEWPDLARTFPRAELLCAAAELLLGREAAAAQRLAGLVEAWPGEADYHHGHVCLLLRRGAIADAARALSHWPIERDGDPDCRPLLLAASLALAQGKSPDLDPLAAWPEAAPAARFLRLRSHAAREEWDECRLEAASLWADGCVTERVALLLAASIALTDAAPPAESWPPLSLPESVVPHMLFLWHRQGRHDEAHRLRELHRDLHGDDPRWQWLAPRFWLDPVRMWIS